MAQSKEQKVQLVDVQTFHGLNTIDDPIALDPGESPYMLNLDITKNGALFTRFGYELAFETTGHPGGLDGVAPYYKSAGLGAGDYLLVFHSNGTVYQFANNNTSATTVGVYGVSTGFMRTTVWEDSFILGNGAPGNHPKKYNLVGGFQDLNSTNVSIFAQFQTQLFAAGDRNSPSSLFYSDPGTLDTNLNINFIPITPGDGQIITGLLGNTDFFQVYKTNSVHGVSIQFDQQLNITQPTQQNIIIAQNGAFSPNSLQSVYGYTYYLGANGVNAYGPNPQRVVADLPLPLSLKIDPTIKQINFFEKDKVCSAFFDNKYIVAVPMGTATNNTNILIYNENVKRRFGHDNWVMYSGIIASGFAVYRDTNLRDQLYFSSALEPKVFRFNQTFSDAGFGYERIWRSKTFQNGERTQWLYLDLQGSKPKGAKMFVDIVTDGQDVTNIVIDDSNFVLSSLSGGYIGDNYIGETYLGAAFSTQDAVPMYKWKKRIRIPSTVNYGYNMYFQIRNYNEGEGWKLNRYKLAYIIDPEDPTYHFTN